MIGDNSYSVGVWADSRRHVDIANLDNARGRTYLDLDIA